MNANPQSTAQHAQREGSKARRERKAGQAVDLDVEEEGHGGPGMLLDEVEPDGGLVGDVFDHPVHAVLHCTATTRRPKKQAEKSRE